MVTPRVVAFDVIETCVPLEPLRARFVDIGQPGTLLETWFTRTLRDGFVFAAAGGFRPFRDVAASALRAVTRDAVGGAEVAHVLDGFAGLPPHPDVAPAVGALRDAGVRVIALTNGSAAVAEGFFARAGVRESLDAIVSIDEVGTWKPAPAVYHHAARRAGVEPAQVALVAAHAWDCYAARRAGLAAAWVSRLEGSFADVFGGGPSGAPPLPSGPDVPAAVSALLGEQA